VEFDYPEDDKFTLTKLKNYRRAKARELNEKQRAAFIEKDKPQFAQQSKPFYLVDPALRYGEKKQVSCRDLEVTRNFKRDADLSRGNENICLLK